MTLLDVNVLVYAARDDSSKDHVRYNAFVETLRNGTAAFGASELVLSGFIRVVTNPKAFKTPTSLDDAIRYVNRLMESDGFAPAHPGVRHWPIFLDLCRSARAKGNLVSDAYHAALALELDAEFATGDRDFTRFPGLRLRHPLD